MQYQESTVSITNGDATVIGSVDVDWTDISAGMWFYVIGGADRYIIDAVIAPGSSGSGQWELELRDDIVEATNAAANYTIHQSFSPVLSAPLPDPQDVETANIVSRAILTLETAISTSGAVAITADATVEIRAKTHGAVGDGVTNDRAAIQSALTAGASAGNFDLVFEPNRKYLLSTARPSGGGESLLVSGLTSSSRIGVIGNGANLHTTLTAGNTKMLLFDTDFDEIKIDNLFFSKSNALALSTQISAICFIPHSTAISRLVDVTNCRFNNVPRTVAGDQATGNNPARYGKLKKMRVQNCVLDYPYGSNSNLAAAADPRVAVLVPAWVDTMYLDDCDFDGGADVSSTGTSPDHYPMDGMLYSHARRNFVRHNYLINFGVEGLFTPYPALITTTSASFAIPSIGNSQFVYYTPDPYGADTDARFTALAAASPQGKIGISDASNIYSPAGQFTVTAVDTANRKLTIRNDGFTFPALDGTHTWFDNKTTGTIGAGTWISLIEANVYSQPPEHWFEYNTINQRAVTGSTQNRANPCIVSHFGRAHVRGNTLRNVTEGINIGSVGSNRHIANPGDESEVIGNHIWMDNWNANDITFTGITIYQGSRNVIIKENIIRVAQSKGIKGIYHTDGNKVINNVVHADSLVYDASYVSRAMLSANASSQAFLDKNYIENFDQGLGIQDGAPFYFGDTNVIRGCTTPIHSVGILVKTKANFSAVASGTQSIPGDGTWTQITASTVQWDATGAYASSTFTAPAPGYYTFVASVLVPANPSATTILQLYKNGTITAAPLVFESLYTYQKTMHGQIRISLAAGNTIKLYIYQNSGSAMTINMTVGWGFFQGSET